MDYATDPTLYRNLKNPFIIPSLLGEPETTIDKCGHLFFGPFDSPQELSNFLSHVIHVA